MKPLLFRPYIPYDILYGETHNPHYYLGLHNLDDCQEKVIRLWRPGATKVYIEVKGHIVEMRKIHDDGLFEFIVSQEIGPLDYRVYHSSGLLAHDPYAFWPTFGQVDEYLFGKGVHYRLYNVLGAHAIFHQGVMGVKFALWAPHARQVSLVADFNHFDGRVNPMRAMGTSGIWEIFIPGLDVGEKYKFEIKTQEGTVFLKADPFANSSELRPQTASIVADLENFVWEDEDFLQKRKEQQSKPKPMSIYEVHLGSWKKKHGNFLNYKELAHDIALYCQDMGFTHVELMPISEHPLDESWGYQVSGFYSVTKRYGDPSDFQYFVNYLHKMGVGVILDWVPGHFPTDSFSLSRFDGTHLYEHQDERQGFHPHWHTCIFNYGRSEVSNFLIANALFWFDKMHIDGLRVDAVASMLYLDYGRENKDWIPNKFGGKENLEAIEFLKHLNSIVHQEYPGVLMIAEESTSFVGVTHPLNHSGLGFDLKWNMGWMNDTLSYFHKDPFFRSHHHNHLTFSIIYAFSEKFCLVLSHDEVVHGKGSLIAKMPGDYWQKFANLRLLYCYMMTHPGKKLLFMGGEIGQWNEWNCKGEVEWFLLQFPIHSGLQRMIKDINHLYLQRNELWGNDYSFEGFEWIDFFDHKNSVISFKRKFEGKELLCVLNFTPAFLQDYFLSLPHVSSLKEVFNSDEEKYGGSGKCNIAFEIYPHGIKFSIAPLATQIYEVYYHD
jgi:1,4-alpha-glucan branching enzyme